MPDRDGQTISVAGRTTTTTAAMTTLASLPVLANAGGSVSILVLCRELSTGDVAHQVRRGLIRVDGGVVTLVGAITTLAQNASASLATLAVAFDGSGGGVRIRVTGIAGRTLEWYGEITAVLLTP